MKKIITLLMLVAVAVAAQAQSLTGKNWFTNQSDNDIDGGLLMMFDPEGACAVSLLIVKTNDNKTIAFTYMVPGMYSRVGDSLKVTLIPKMAEVNCDIEGMSANEIELMQPVIDEQKQQLKVSLAEDFDWDEEPFTIDELTDSRLVLTDSEGAKMVFVHVEE